MNSDTLQSVYISGSKVSYSVTSASVSIPVNRNRVLYKVDKAAAASKPVKDRPHAYEEVEVFLPRDGTTPTKGPMLEKMVDPHVAKVLENNQENPVECEDPYFTPASREDELYMQLETLKIQNIIRENIEITGMLGNGQFGEIQVGIWNCSPDEKCEVAIKTLNPETTKPDAKVKFLQEAVIIAQFRHPNVIGLHGTVGGGEPVTTPRMQVTTPRMQVMLALELAHNRDLRTHLHTLRQEEDPAHFVQPEVCLRLLGYSKQIAFGMKYLSSRFFVHRDLAARNVLVTKDYICKIGDFGMSRDLADDLYYFSKGGMVPVKWTAPEAIHFRKYSTASDVWSYGCLLYEIWSLGCKPYEGTSNAEVIEAIDCGYRLPPPPGCPLSVYQLMIECWNPEKRSRPTFHDVYISLCQSPEFVLKVPDEAHLSHPQAAILGASLDAGKKLYIDLQKAYV